MSVFKRADAETYSFDFYVRGRRFSGNTEARSKKDAEAVERQLKAKAKADMETERGPATARFYCATRPADIGRKSGSIIATAQEHGTRLSCSRNTSALTSA